MHIKIQLRMINKAVGYGAFKTYGELPYPTRKQGKQLELTNKIWQSTTRAVDQTKPLDNFNNGKTVYKQTHVENTNPADYHPEHVPKGGARTLNFDKSGAIKAYDRQQAAKYGKTNQITDPNNPKYDERKNKMLASGTQHWKSVYNQANQSSMRYKSSNKNKTDQDALDNLGTANLSNAGKNSDSNQAGMRSNSLGGKSQQQIAEQAGRARSYKNRPYINDCKMGLTDYKFNYGQKIGSTPLDLMNRVSYKQPLRDHPLKRGTNQLWTQIPNYQGFKPSELSFKQYQEKIQRRNEQNKGNMKLQVADNFLVQVPGYAGFKPQFQKTASNLRQSCLSSKMTGAN